MASMEDIGVNVFGQNMENKSLQLSLKKNLS